MAVTEAVANGILARNADKAALVEVVPADPAADTVKAADGMATAEAAVVAESAARKARASLHPTASEAAPERAGRCEVTAEMRLFLTHA